MQKQKNVLLVTNSMQDFEIHQIKETLAAAPQNEVEKINLSLVHFMPTLPISYFNIPSMVLLAERYYEEAKKSLHTVGDFLTVHQRNQWLLTGRPRFEVLRLARKLNMHFILANADIIPELRKSFFGIIGKNVMPIKHINQLNVLSQPIK